MANYFEKKPLVSFESVSLFGTEIDNSISYGKWSNSKTLDNLNYTPLQEFDQNHYKFDPKFTNTINDGSAFILQRPLSKELAGQLKIKKTKYQEEDVYTVYSKELTIGLLDGEFSNRLDMVHFNKIFSIDPDSV